MEAILPDSCDFFLEESLPSHRTENGSAMFEKHVDEVQVLTTPSGFPDHKSTGGPTVEMTVLKRPDENILVPEKPQPGLSIVSDPKNIFMFLSEAFLTFSIV